MNPMDRIKEAGYLGVTITWDKSNDGYYGYLLAYNGQYDHALHMRTRYADFDELMFNLAEHAERLRRETSAPLTKQMLLTMLKNMSPTEREKLEKDLRKL